MSEIKKHYMRVKRKILREKEKEEFFFDDLSTIDKKNKIASESNMSESVTQSEGFESNILGSNLLLQNESDESNEWLPVSSSLSPDLLNSTICKPNEENNSKQIKSTLLQWSLKYNISRIALSDLLKLLQSYISNLLIDARSLLGTYRTIVIKVIDPGEYYYFGIENCIKNLICYSNNFFKYTNIIELAINIDG